MAKPRLATPRPKVRPSNLGQGVTVVDHQDMDLSAALLVTGFPGVGFVGTIATNFLVQSLNLGRIASVVSGTFPPYAVVREGRPFSPVRIHAAPMVCGLDGKCDQLAVVLSEVMPRPEDMFPLGESLLRWAKAKGAQEVVALEGVKTEAPEAKEPALHGVANSPEAIRRLERMGIQLLEEGLLSGFSGILTYLGEALEMDVICLIADTREGIPDARGAARVVEALKVMIPHITIDSGPLHEQAELIEGQIKASLDKHRDALDSISEQSRMMYG